MNVNDFTSVPLAFGKKTHLNFILRFFFPGGFYFVQFVLKVFDLSLFMNQGVVVCSM